MKQKRSKARSKATPNPFFNSDLTAPHTRAPLVLSTVLKSTTFLVVLGAVCAYIIVQIILAGSAPGLEITSPPSGHAVSSSFSYIEGVAERDATVTIDDVPIITNKDGVFRKSVVLQPGANSFFVRVYDRAENVREVEYIIVSRAEN